MLVVAPTLDVDMLHAGVEQLKAHVLPSYADAGVVSGKDIQIAALHSTTGSASLSGCET